MPKDDFDFEANEDLKHGEKEDDESKSNEDQDDEVDFFMDDDIEEEEDKDDQEDEVLDALKAEKDDDDKEDDEEDKEEDGEVDDKAVKKGEEDEGEYSKIREDILAVVGEETVLKVKGKEYKAGDLSSQELVKYVQKGIRADQIFQEQAQTRRELDRNIELVNRGRDTVQRLLDEKGQTSGTRKLEPQVPEFLKPNELDTAETKQLKEYTADLHNRVQTLETGQTESRISQAENEIVSEIRSLQKEYPQAVVDEVLAVKTIHPDESTEGLMRASHGYYSGTDFVWAALEANPTTKREITEKIVRQHSLKKSKTGKVGMKRSRTSGSEKVSTKARKKPGIDYDFDSADTDARDFVSEVDKLSRR